MISPRPVLLAAVVFLATTACQKNPGPTPEEEQALLDTGRAATKALMESLGGQLKTALDAGGPVTALTVCQSVAGPLTDAVGQSVPGATIRRVTRKPRNPANAADMVDLVVLRTLEVDAERPEERTLWTRTEGRYYKPLLIQEVCLKCHGAPDTFPADLTAALAELYPADKATGYALGDLRGAIRVDIPRQP